MNFINELAMMITFPITCAFLARIFIKGLKSILGW